MAVPLCNEEPHPRPTARHEICSVAKETHSSAA